MTQKTYIRKSKSLSLPVLEAVVALLCLALILSYWTSILTFFSSDTSVQETTTPIPKEFSQQVIDRSSKTPVDHKAPFSRPNFPEMRARLNSGTISKESPQKVLDRILMTADRDEFSFFELSDLALYAEDVEIRVDAIECLRVLADERVVDPLPKALTDESAMLRAAAVEMLAEADFGPVDDMAMELISRALEDPDAQVRSNAVRALGSLGADESIDDLAWALNDGDAEVRSAAVDVLGTLGGERTTKLLTKVLFDPDAQVSQAAGMVLAQIKEKEIDEIEDDSVSQKPEDEETQELKEGLPAMPGLPGYPTDPPAERIERGEPGSTPSGEGTSN